MIQNKNIQIDDIQTKMSSTGNTKYILISGKDKYYFWENEKGGESSVFQSFGEMKKAGRLKGSAVAIGFTEEDEEFTNAKGELIKYKSRHIVGLRETDGQDIGNGIRQYQSSQPAKSSNRGQNTASQSNTDWDQIAVGKCQTAFLAAYIQAGNTFADTKLQVVPARKLAELVVYGTQQPEELPTITYEDDPAGDFNPMVNDAPPLTADDLPPF